MKSAFFSGLAFGSAASAHSIFQQLSVDGVTQGLYNGVRVVTYDGPVQDVSQAALACNTGFATPISNGVVTIPAGSKVGAWWQHVLGGPQGANDVDNPISVSHHGPIMTYLAKVDSFSNATNFDFTQLNWFKIAQDSYDPSTNVWGVDNMVKNNGWSYFTMPSCIKPGNYIMRHEALALHAASGSGGAQFYMECANIAVTGSTGTLTPDTVKFPGAYKATDPGVLINIYQKLSTYIPPGPTPIMCSPGSGSGPTTISTSVKPTTTTTTTTSTTTKALPTTSITSATTTTKTTSTTTTTKTTTSSAGPTSTTACSPVYGQCGGIGWNGPTCCASGSVCSDVGESVYYNQCLPK